MKRRWTKEEDELLRINYPTQNIKYCCDMLKRSKDSISQRVRRLGLKREFLYKTLTKDMLIEEYIQNRKSISKIGNEFGLSPNQVYEAIVFHNIPVDKTGMNLFNKNHNWRGFGEISSTYWSQLQKSARQRKIDFNITIEYVWNIFLEQNRVCALSGIDIRFSSRSQAYYKLQTASLDRIDSNQGYVIGNVQWVHKKINQIKMDLDQKEFIELCGKVYIYNQ